MKHQTIKNETLFHLMTGSWLNVKLAQKISLCHFIVAARFFAVNLSRRRPLWLAYSTAIGFCSTLILVSP